LEQPKTNKVNEGWGARIAGAVKRHHHDHAYPEKYIAGADNAQRLYGIVPGLYIAIHKIDHWFAEKIKEYAYRKHKYYVIRSGCPNTLFGAVGLAGAQVLPG